MIIADVVPSIEFWRLALGAGIASLILVSVFVWCAGRLGVISDERTPREPDAVDELDAHRRDRELAMAAARSAAPIPRAELDRVQGRCDELTAVLAHVVEHGELSFGCAMCMRAEQLIVPIAGVSR